MRAATLLRSESFTYVSNVRFVKEPSIPSCKPAKVWVEVITALARTARSWRDETRNRKHKSTDQKASSPGVSKCELAILCFRKPSRALAIQLSISLPGEELRMFESPQGPNTSGDFIS